MCKFESLRRTVAWIAHVACIFVSTVSAYSIWCLSRIYGVWERVSWHCNVHPSLYGTVLKLSSVSYSCGIVWTYNPKWLGNVSQRFRHVSTENKMARSIIFHFLTDMTSMNFSHILSHLKLLMKEEWTLIGRSTPKDRFVECCNWLFLQLCF